MYGFFLCSRHLVLRGDHSPHRKFIHKKFLFSSGGRGVLKLVISNLKSFNWRGGIKLFTSNGTLENLEIFTDVSYYGEDILNSRLGSSPFQLF